MLQEGAFSKLGSRKRRQVDVRLIAATSESLEQMIAQKRFRKDLYYRLRGGWLHLPPLRERREDILPLTRFFLEKYYDVDQADFIEKEALALLMRYPYPGNIRELKSTLQSAVILANGAPIRKKDLPAHITATLSMIAEKPVPDNAALRPLAEVERAHILMVYEQSGRNKSQAARRLGIGLNTLRRKLARYRFD